MIKHPDLSLYTISTDNALLDVDMIHSYLSKESYWAIDIPYETVSRSIEHSMCFGVFYDGKQMGFARLITDKATFAYLADVFILNDHRGKGLSKWLMQTIHDHSELQGLRRWMLGTRDAHALYEQFGWAVLTEEVRPRFMQKHFPDVYKTTGNK